MTVPFALLPAALVMVAMALSCAPACAPASDGNGHTLASGAYGRATTLTVFAAASLAESLRALGAAFEADNPGLRVAFNFAGSQTLRTQLEHGASADVFASADWRQMAAVQDAGLLGSPPQYFAANRLAIAAPAGSDAVQSLHDLARPDVAIAIAAAPVPAGAYARDTLTLLAADAAYPDDYAHAALANVVTNETSVRGVAQKVVLGEVDAGIVYETDAKAAQYADAIRMIEIPLQFNPAAQYPIAALSTAGPRLESALQFIAFVQGDDGQAILRAHGFAPPANVACPCHASEANGG